MKHTLWLSQFVLLIMATGKLYSQTQTQTQEYSYGSSPPPIIYQNSSTSLPGAPTTPSSGLPSLPSSNTSTLPGQSSPSPIIYQNSLTAPPVINPSTSLPGAPTTPSSGLPGLPSSNTSTLPGLPMSSSTGSLVQTLYPQTAPTQSYSYQQTGPQFGTPKSPGLKFNPKPYETPAPPTSYLPGIATINEGKWMVSDFLYNLTNNIGVKAEIIKPQGQYIPLSEQLLEQLVAKMFQDANIEPSAIQMNCQPPLPMFYVLVMAYPLDNRIVGFISVQLYEEAKPIRIDMDLNGVWQTITWERQALVASSTEDFAQEINETLKELVLAFTTKFKYYHPADERSCFPKH